MTTPARPLGPVHLFADREGDESCLTLLDGQSRPRIVRGGADLARMAALSAAVRRGSTNAQTRTEAGRALYELLFPGAVGAFLRESPSRALSLQLPLELDALAWEHAGEPGQAIGQKFAVTRWIAWPDGAELLAEDASSALDAALRVARVDARAASAQALEGASLPGPAPGPDRRSIARGTHVVRAIGGPLTAALVRNELPPHRSLIVGEIGGGQQRIEVVRELLRGGHLLLDLGPVSTMAAQDDLFSALCEQLETGHSVAESLRRMRGLPATARRGASSLVLYGRTDCAFVRPNRAGLTQREQRPVTALSYDIVNSTGALQKLDGERYGQLNKDLHRKCQAIVARYGGVSRDAQGNDGCMNYFGYGAAREDDAVRALHAAREIAATFVEVKSPKLKSPGIRLRVRVGVATGEVSMQWGDLYGLSIHLAAHLQSRAKEGTVLVSPLTQRLTSHRFDLQPLLQKLRLKNIRGAQQAWELVGPRRDLSHEPPSLTPFVGRDAQLAALRAAWDAACAGSARAVLVAGDAGIGKSRLLREFRRGVSASEAHLLQLRCTREGSAGAFHPLVEAVRDALDLQADDAPAAALDKLARATGVSALDADDRVMLARLLDISHELPQYLVGAAPERVRQRMLGVLLRWFEAVAHERPLCLLVEDIHWIDRSTAEFLDGLLARDEHLRLLTVVTRRHGRAGEEETDITSDWVPAAASERIELQGLSTEAATALIGKLCHARMNVPALRLLVQRGDGVPLYLEESARMALALRSPSVKALKALVPEVLSNLLIAQVDSLGLARKVLLLGSVLGREFSASLLQAVVSLGGFDVLAQELDAWLAIAERSGLLRAVGEGERRRYVFKHALVCDAANNLLQHEDRAAMHRAVVKALRGPARELAARQPELLAVHLAGSGRKSLAFEQWQQAAASAESRSSRHEQASHLHSAIDLLKDRVLRGRRQRDRKELDLQLKIASCYLTTEGYGAELVELTCKRAADLSRVLDDKVSLLTSELGLEACYFMRANFPLAMTFALRAEAMAARIGRERQHLQARWAIANIRFHQGDGLEAVRLMDECLVDYREPPKDKLRNSYAQDPAVMCWSYSGWGRWELGHPDDAVARVGKALALARRLEHPFSIAVATAFTINVHHYRGETELALECAERCLALCDEHGFPVWRAHALVMRGRLRCEQGALRDGLRDMADGNALWAATKATVTRPLYLAMHAEGLAMNGQPEQGMALLDQAMALVAENGERYYEAELHRLTARLTLACAAKAGTPAGAAQIEAERSLLAGLVLANTQGKRGFELRSAIDLACLWRDCGDHERAHRLLAPLRKTWTEGLFTRDVRTADEVLQSLLPAQAHEEEHVR
jgi:class 3 adenylate cyclase